MRLKLLGYGSAEKDLAGREVQELRRSRKNFILLDVGEENVQDLPARRITCSYTSNTAPYFTIRLMRYWIVRDKKAIIVSYFARPQKYTEYLPLVQKMMGSLKVKV